MATVTETVLITGGSRGIGAALVGRLVRPGRRIYLNHRDSAKEARALEAAGDVVVIQADLTDRSSVAAMMDHIRADHGSLNVLVHNAAAPLVPCRVSKLEWATDVQPQIDVACRGLLYCVQEAGPLLTSGGRLVVMLTDALFHTPPVQMGAYLIAKGALWGLTRALAKELHGRHIKVNSVSPGMTATDLLHHYDPRALEIIAADHPHRRLATPGEVADVVAMLVDHAPDYVHGANITVNGGAEF